MIALCLSTALAIAQASSQLDKGALLTDPVTKQPSSRLIEFTAKLSPPKIAPRTFGPDHQQWTFDWHAAAYGAESGRELLRFMVFSQERSDDHDRGEMVAQMLARLWEYNYHSLNMDHSSMFGNGRIDVYLCWKGLAGGEQLFDSDPQYGSRPEKVNTIYIYDLNSFTSPVEMAREVAHEYGHATLPAIGGYTEPENWANGYLGERVFLRHISEMMSNNLLGPDDAMGASAAQLKVWVSANVEPLVARAAASGPNMSQLENRSKAGMDSYMGLALYVDTVLPEKVFSRSMELVGSTDAKDYPDAIVLAAEEPDRYTLRIPRYLAGKPIWIPVGDHAKVFGATIARRNGDWAVINPGPGSITVVNRASQ
jgi:hypothetical protein